MSDKPTLVIGTAGHIDHGKSRLVTALTGTDPDRLPEEKSRGMTIDLGFAHTRIEDCEVSFVDVPGHERFIRNMVAGATGVDVAVLVVAADDSVMPQTREHAEVLALLGVERVLLVLTKMDLMDDEWGDAVEEEARELLARLDIEPIACIRTSAETGRGLDELRQALLRVARDPKRARIPYRWFRMPIDRAFIVAGRGTVVTGSVAHGAVRCDEELDLWPDGRRVRVRDLQTHHDARSAAGGKMRLALNLAATSTEDVGRGRELATPGCLRPTRILDAWVATLRMPGKIRRKTLRLRLHLATNDVLAELTLINKPTADSCRGEFGQLRVAQPVVATWGQHFILRDESAMRTLGGGRILRPYTRRWNSRHPAHLAGLQTLLDGKPKERLEEVIRDSTWQVVEDGPLASAAGLADAAEAAGACRSLVDKGRAVQLDAAGQRLLLHATQLAALGDDLTRRLQAHLKDNPRLGGIPRSEWPAWMPRACPARHRPVLADWFIAQGHVLMANDRVVPRGHKDALSPEDQQLFEQMLAEFDEHAFQPPAPNALRCHTSRNAKRLTELIKLATMRGQLVRIADGIWLHHRRREELAEIVVGALRQREQLTVADVRTLLDSSRKYVVPIVEHLDAAGITRREGDSRTLGPKAQNPKPKAQSPKPRAQNPKPKSEP